MNNHETVLDIVAEMWHTAKNRDAVSSKTVNKWADRLAGASDRCASDHALILSEMRKKLLDAEKKIVEMHLKTHSASTDPLS